MPTQHTPEAIRLAACLEHYDTLGLSRVFAQSSAELRRLYVLEANQSIWLEKTEWVQDTAQHGELGLHRADVMKQRFDRLHEENNLLIEECNKVRANYSRLHEVNQELLEALKLITEVGDRSATEIARAAIAKATGEANVTKQTSR